MVVGGLYEALFNMLRKRRFDCFLRSVIEIEDELTQHRIWPSNPTVFRYPLALLFFVSPRYPELAKRIELGLLRARQSGDYERIFEAGFGSTIRRLQLDRRVMLELSNPDLPTGSRAMMQDPRSSMHLCCPPCQRSDPCPRAVSQKARISGSSSRFLSTAMPTSNGLSAGLGSTMRTFSPMGLWSITAAGTSPTPKPSATMATIPSLPATSA